MAPRLSALVLAAGLSSRMGRLKPLLPLDPKGGQTPLGLCVGLFRAAGMTEVVVVTGHRCDEVGPAARVGFRVVVLDDRAEFASRQRFPLADEVRVLASFADCLPAAEIDSDSYLVIVTRGHLHDLEVLEQALRTPAGYIGMIGSRKKRNSIYTRLLDRGVTEAQLEQVRCPIGMAIEADTPEEIAVSIVGELIYQRATGRKAWHLA